MNRSARIWASFDSVKKAFALGIVSLGFPLTLAAAAGPGCSVEAYISLGLILGNLFSGIMAPILGQWADHHGRRHILPFLGLIVLVGVIAIPLFASAPLTATVFFTATFASYQVTVSLYDAMLPGFSGDHASRSSIAWGLGFSGSLSVLLLIGASSSATYPVHPGIFVLIGLVFLCGTWMIRGVSANSPADPKDSPKETTFRDKGKILLLLFFVYEGIETLTVFVPLYSKNELGLEMPDLLLGLALMQIVAIPATLAGARLSRRFGIKKIMSGSLLIWILVCIALSTISSKGQMMIVFASTGLVLGSTKALIRAHLALTIVGNRANFGFGLSTMISRGSVILGPLIFGVLASVTGSFRLSFLIHTLFFLGAIVLVAFTVPEKGYEK